jgi:hypothetical protein
VLICHFHVSYDYSIDSPVKVRMIKIKLVCEWRSRLRHYATSRKVASSIPDVVIGFFN